MSLKEVLESYKHIDLTEDEMTEAVIEAKRKKEAILKAEERRRQEEENRKLFTNSQWSFEQTKSFMLYRSNQLYGGDFILDENNTAIFNLLCYYFSDDMQFVSFAENMGVKEPALSKGIMIAGNFGVGKTWMMKLFMKNQRQVYHVYNAKYVADAYEREGESSVESFIIKPKNAYNDPAVFYQSSAGLCLDDIGTEDLKNSYGNKRNVIGDIIERRYEKGNTGIWLHVTTNLSVDQMKEFYGGRVISRLRESMNFIELSGNDRRK